MDNRIDKVMYQLEDLQEELKDLESTDRGYLLERIADVRSAAEELISTIEDIEIGED